jgi:pilus assembly protein CpaE
VILDPITLYRSDAITTGHGALPRIMSRGGAFFVLRQQRWLTEASNRRGRCTMNAWIIAENKALFSRLGDALAGQAINCPTTNILTIEALSADLHRLAGCEGVFFIAASRLTQGHLESIRSIRAVIDKDALIVAVSGAADPTSVLGAVRVGANDFLALNDQFDEELRRFFSRVRVHQRSRDDSGRILTVLPCHSSADANAVALNLAAVFASHTTSCGLIDLHFRGGDLALLLKQTPRHTIIDLLTQRDPLDEAMLRQVVTPHKSGIQLLAGPTSLVDLSSIRPQACHELISLAQQAWPVVVINVEDVQHVEQIRALSVSEDIVLTVRLDIVSLHRAQRHIELLTENHVSRERVHVVAIGTGLSGELPVAAVKKVLQVTDVRCIPDDPVAMIRSVNLGNPLVLEQPTSNVAIALRQFAESLIGAESVRTYSGSSMTTLKAAAVIAAQAFCK